MTKPNLLVAIPHFGRVSEVWMRRQIDLFSAFDVSILSWDVEELTPEPAQLTVLNELEWNSHATSGRWLMRAQNCGGRNFFAGTRKEKQCIQTAIESSQPDIVLAHFGPTTLKILPVTRRMGLPITTHFHGYDLSSALRSPWYRWSLQSQVQELSASIVVGQFQRKILMDMGQNEDQIFCIPCGVPTEDFTPGKERSAKSLRFIFVGRLVAQKGVDIALHAFAGVLSSHPHAELAIVGSGPAEESIKKLVQDLGLASNVQFTGDLLQNEVIRELQASDVYVQHSLPGTDGSVEGFGVSIAEASACGLPVIATDTGGIPDQINDGENGFLVTPGDVDAMKQRMSELANSSESRVKMGLAGRTRAEALFDTATQVAKLERVLLDALKEHQ